MEIAGQCLGIKGLDHKSRLAGCAFALAYAPVGHPGGTVDDFIDDGPAGHVVVIDNGKSRTRDAVALGMRLDEARKPQQNHLLWRREPAQ